jgi:hypothetical protein
MQMCLPRSVAPLTLAAAPTTFAAAARPAIRLLPLLAIAAAAACSAAAASLASALLPSHLKMHQRSSSKAKSCLITSSRWFADSHSLAAAAAVRSSSCSWTKTWQLRHKDFRISATPANSSPHTPQNASVQGDQFSGDVVCILLKAIQRLLPCSAMTSDGLGYSRQHPLHQTRRVSGVTQLCPMKSYDVQATVRQLQPPVMTAGRQLCNYRCQDPPCASAAGCSSRLPPS